MTQPQLNKELSVAVIQTSLDYQAAWGSDSLGSWESAVQISEIEERRAKKEIRHFLSSLRGSTSDSQPNIILLPELAVPIGFGRQLRRSAEKLESIIIAGMDYRIEAGAKVPTVSNEAVVTVPRKISGRKVGASTQVRRVGKTYPAPGEKVRLDRVEPKKVEFKSDPMVWLFEGDKLGNFAVAVCYDFMDLDRIVMYRNRIQTLFILAYNRDTSTFDHIAEALSRMLFCNVVVCNCGKFGGSLAVSPYSKSYRRTVYRHSGQALTNAQIVRLPLQALAEHQADGERKEFKSLPPGFTEFQNLLKHMNAHTIV